MKTAIIVGAGHRAVLYASYALARPDMLKIVGVADPNPLRREQVAARFGFGKEMCFDSAERLAERPRLADAIINGTMDHQHCATSLPLLRRGYDMLLEKPFVVNEDEMRLLAETAKEYGNTVMICHVLRYAPFYVEICKRLRDGEIGDVINIQAAEHVSYHHHVVGYVRGKWNNTEKCHSTMLLAKCCHDMDLLVWLKSGVAPVSVASHGSNFQFTPEARPKGAGTRCLVDCPIEAECLYSARKHYIDHPYRWSFYVWDSLEHIENPTIEQKIESLKTDNPFGRCVWGCDNNVVDHQSVMMNFEDGCTATMNMVGGCSKPQRTLHIIGTKGEIYGALEESKFTVCKMDPRPGHEYAEEVVDLNAKGDGSGALGDHGGGDLRLVEDFVKRLHGETPSISCTDLKDSISGHLAVFRADLARECGRVISLQ